MADHTGIEWTDATWNPVVGCSLVSPGCTHCYAMGQAARIVRCSEGLNRASTYDGTVETVKGRAVWTGKVALASDATLTQPLRWKRPRRIFVNSMGDLFHEDVPDEWIDRVFAVMALSPQHTYQILTKRSARMRAYFTDPRVMGRIARVLLDAVIEGSVPVRDMAKPSWPVISIGADIDEPDDIALRAWPLPNLWLGVSAEDQRRADERIPDLLATPAAIRFVSAEPLLGPIDFMKSWEVKNGLLRLAFPALDWIIVGGESGKGARPMHPDWARAIRDQCAAAGTTFFFKQWGEWLSALGWYPDHPVSLELKAWHGAGWREVEGSDDNYMARIGKARAGRLLDGVTHDAMPEARHG